MVGRLCVLQCEITMFAARKSVSEEKQAASLEFKQK